MLEDDDLKSEYTAKRIAHWDGVALRKRKINCGRYYHKRLTKIYQFLVSSGQRVCEIGCGEGDLLAALMPSVGVGIDFSKEMIRRAEKKHPSLTFIQADCHDVKINETFDVIIFSDILNDLWDVQRVFQNIKPLVNPRTRIIINSYSRLWEKPLNIARRLRLSRPTLAQNWFTVEDIVNILG
ncbi:MAG: class I SAM-dependent methyltransferase, partial [Candidatus Aminicenantes bacterium]|nr:class I SAM-dependent methyltransferase [Candidatus Aminicenantes bacterium]